MCGTGSSTRSAAARPSGMTTTKMQIEPIPVFLETAVQNCIPCELWKLPAMVCSEGDEEGMVVLLDVWEPTAVIVLSLRKNKCGDCVVPGL